MISGFTIKPTYGTTSPKPKISNTEAINNRQNSLKKETLWYLVIKYIFFRYLNFKINTN